MSSVFRSCHALLFGVLLMVLGCGDYVPGTAVHDASAGVVPGMCEVLENTDGSRTLQCSDGTSITVRDGDDGGVCSAQARDEGIFVVCDGVETGLGPGQKGRDCTITTSGEDVFLSCDDGTLHELFSGRDGDEVSARRIEGRARLQGLSSHAGIAVELRGVEGFVGVTDAEGDYALEAVPPGVYTLDFRFPGFLDASIKDVLVLEGTQHIADVELRSSLLQIMSSDWLRILGFSEDGDSLYIGRSLSEGLWHYDVRRSILEPLSPDDGELTWSADGETTVFSERLSGDTDIVVWSRRSGRLRAFTLESRYPKGLHISPSAGYISYYADVPGTTRPQLEALYVLDLDTGVVHEVSRSYDRYDVAEWTMGEQLLWHGYSSETSPDVEPWLFEPSTGQSRELLESPGAGLARMSPDRRHILVTANQPSTRRVFNSMDGSFTPLSSDSSLAEWSADGSSLLFRDAGLLKLWVRDSGEIVLVSDNPNRFRQHLLGDVVLFDEDISSWTLWSIESGWMNTFDYVSAIEGTYDGAYILIHERIDDRVILYETATRQRVELMKGSSVRIEMSEAGHRAFLIKDRRVSHCDLAKATCQEIGVARLNSRYFVHPIHPLILYEDEENAMRVWTPESGSVVLEEYTDTIIKEALWLPDNGSSVIFRERIGRLVMWSAQTRDSLVLGHNADENLAISSRHLAFVQEVGTTTLLQPLNGAYLVPLP